MSQLSIALLSMQKNSKFAKAYRDGINKKNYWEFFLEDSLDLISKIPRVASIIYNNVFKNRRATPIADPKLNLSQNFVHMMGHTNNPGLVNLISHYLVLHSDHEGGNVSAHATQLVGSALSDPYLSYSAGLNG